MRERTVSLASNVDDAELGPAVAARGVSLNSYIGLATAAAWALSVLALTSLAQAEPRHALALSGAQALSEPPAPEAQQEDELAEARDPTPMAILGIGVKLGVAGTARSKLTVTGDTRSLQSRIDPRRGFHASVPLQFGASGFGWTLEPYVSRSSISHALRNESGVLTGGSEQVDLTAWGIYTGPVVNIHVVRPLYLSLGLGVRGAYIANDGFDYAFDAYMRAPIGATYYVTDQLALVVELGLGYGLSIFADHPRVRIDPLTNRLRSVPEEPQVGKAFAWDCTLGVRLP